MVVVVRVWPPVRGIVLQPSLAGHASPPQERHADAYQGRDRSPQGCRISPHRW